MAGGKDYLPTTGPTRSDKWKSGSQSIMEPGCPSKKMMKLGEKSWMAMVKNVDEKIHIRGKLVDALAGNVIQQWHGRY